MITETTLSEEHQLLEDARKLCRLLSAVPKISKWLDSLSSLEEETARRRAHLTELRKQTALHENADKSLLATVRRQHEEEIEAECKQRRAETLAALDTARQVGAKMMADAQEQANKIIGEANKRLLAAQSQ